MDYILNTNFAEGISIITKAKEKETDQIIWEMWLSLYPNMNKDNFISFNDFKNKITNNKKNKNQTDDEMLAKVKILNAAFGGEVIYV